MADQIPEGIRDVGLAGVGAVIYLALSPDIVDGLSDEEFKVLKENGPAFFELTEALGRTGVIPEGYRLPTGFAKHFEKDVLPDIEEARENAGARNQARSEIRDVLKSPGKLSQLYRKGGETYSDILARSVGDNARSSNYDFSKVVGLGGTQL